MSTPQVEQLLEKWRQLRDRGVPVSSEELCRDCPELVPELRRLLDQQTPTITPDSDEEPNQSQASDLPSLPRDRIVEDAEARATREEADTLRARLRLAVIVFLVHWLVFFVLVVRYGFRTPYSAAFEVIVLVVTVVVLRRRQEPMAFSSLRWLELFVFGAITQRILIGQGVAYLQDFREAVNSSAGLAVYSDNIAMPWIEVIIVYGLFIPNELRRTAVIVTGLAILPLLLLVSVASYHDALGQATVATTLELVGLRIAFAVAIAILGSHRMQKLQRQAREARELGQYSLKQRLGQGGMADVYLAEHRLLSRLCAIKLIRAETAGDPHAQRRFAREVRAMSRLRHPNIVEIFDYGVSAEGKFYYVMEYLMGFNLEELVQRHGPLPPERAVYLLRQIVSALEAMHEKGVIHRDIKPSNIFLSAPDVVKLFDFGLVYLEAAAGALTSTDAGRLTRDDRIVGTPAYMAPEQIDLSRPINARTDTYAVGLVAYFLLAGGNPFARDEVRKIFAAQVSEEPPPLRELVPEVPTDLAGIVHRCLAKNPSDRYPHAASLREAIEACVTARTWNAASATAWWRERAVQV